jgi:hypothetical protein
MERIVKEIQGSNLIQLCPALHLPVSIPKTEKPG